MNDSTGLDSIGKRIDAITSRIAWGKENGFYYYHQPIEEILSDSRVRVNGRVMSMYASYGYLGLLGHPRINAAAKRAVDKYGTGTYGARALAGTLSLHRELEETIAEFKHAEDALTFTSGYVTNMSVISALVTRGDVVFCDKLNHASIYDGCLASRAKFERFEHNDLQDLERGLAKASRSAAKLVIVDAVFSMDGDFVDLPAVSALCKKYGAWLMVDEAHSLGVMGETGRGIEEHYGMEDAIDIKMGTLSKAIPSSGGYVAGKRDLIDYLRFSARGYMYSGSLSPAHAAAAIEGFKVMLDEPWRLEKLRANTTTFIDGLQGVGLDTMLTRTAIVPVLCGDDLSAFRMTQAAQERNVFVLPVISPVVPNGSSRLRATVTAAHERDDIMQAIDVIGGAARELGLVA